MAKSLQTDIAIIGGGMSAALLARILHNETLLKIDIFEAGAQIGGNHQAINTPFGSMDYGPKIIPNKAEYAGAVKFLGEVLGHKLIEGFDGEIQQRQFFSGFHIAGVGRPLLQGVASFAAAPARSEADGA